MWILVPVLALAALGTSPAPASDCQISDLMPAFWSFQETAREKPPADRYRSFVEMVQGPNAVVYEGVFHDVSKPRRSWFRAPSRESPESKRLGANSPGSPRTSFSASPRRFARPFPISGARRRSTFSSRRGPSTAGHAGCRGGRL